jgi:hypothetical protein
MPSSTALSPCVSEFSEGISRTFQRDDFPQYIWSSSFYPKSLLVRSSRPVIADFDSLSVAASKLGSDTLSNISRLFEALAVESNSEYLCVYDTGSHSDALSEFFGREQIEFLHYDEREFETALNIMISCTTMEFQETEALDLLDQKSESWSHVIVRLLTDAERIAATLKSGSCVLIANGSQSSLHEELATCLILLVEVLLDPLTRSVDGLMKAFIREFGVRGQIVTSEDTPSLGIALVLSCLSECTIKYPSEFEFKVSMLLFHLILTDL